MNAEQWAEFNRRYRTRFPGGCHCYRGGLDLEDEVRADTAADVPRCGHCGLPHCRERLDGELCGPCRVQDFDRAHDIEVTP